MLTCFLRSSLMVNDETPTSYFPVLVPAMIESKLEGTNSTSTPNFWPTALKRSTSKPCTVLPSPARNSLGAEEAAVPTTIFLPVFALSGSLAASAESAVAEATVFELEPPAEDSESDPHADRDRTTPAPMTTPAASPRERSNTRAS